MTFRPATLHIDARACRELWRAVLLTVVGDLCGRSLDPGRRKGAERWIGLWPSRDFLFVCELADVEASALHKRLSELAACPLKERRKRLDARFAGGRFIPVHGKSGLPKSREIGHVA